MIKKLILENYLNDMGVLPETSDIEKLYCYLDLLFEYNKNVNLVGTKERSEILTRHFFDCLSIFKLLNSNYYKNIKIERLLDIGTGAGLPGILVSIFLKKTEVFLLDSKNKSITFLKYILNSLGLDNVFIISGRAEELAHNSKYREIFDIVVSRAFAKTSILSEISIPFCKIGGRAVLYKSRNLQEELRQSEQIIKITGAKVENILEVKIPCLDEYRALLILKKDKSTIYKYPRKYGKILEMPIIV